MRRVYPGALALLFLALLGCGDGGQDDALIKQEITLNQDTAAAFGKVSDWAGYVETREKYEQKRDEIEQKRVGWPAKKTRDLMQRYGRELEDSQARIDAALEELLPKLESEAANPVVVLETSMGAIKIQLFEKSAPITVKNFLAYVDDKFYDGTIFHRVIPGFMVQGGGFAPGMQEKKTRAPIKNESYNRLTNRRGTLAMARTSVADSATAQFFINVVDNSFLNRSRAQDGVGYAVFGNVIDGMEVVDKIRHVPTATRGGHENVPVQDVVITSVRRAEKK